jgi:hypothetical protein
MYSPYELLARAASWHSICATHKKVKLYFAVQQFLPSPEFPRSLVKTELADT